MKKDLYILIPFILFLSGCTQVVTAPISAAGAVAGAAIDVTGSAVGAAVHVATSASDDEGKEEKKE